MAMSDNTKQDFVEAFEQATKPFHVALGTNKAAIETLAEDNKKHNKKQDAILDTLILQHKAMQETQLSYGTTQQNITASLDKMDKKMDVSNVNFGRALGTIESLANQNKEQFQRLGVLETHAAIGDLPKAEKVEDKSAVILLLGDKTVRIGIMLIATIIVYGMFKLYGVDVKDAKELLTLGQMDV